MNTQQNPINQRGLTYKQIKELSKGKKYPYDYVANKLNNLQSTELNTIDKIIAEGEITSMHMVGIKKLYNMVTNQQVKDEMKKIYQL